jgi:hypothetical protein
MKIQPIALFALHPKLELKFLLLTASAKKVGLKRIIQIAHLAT